MGRHVKEIRDLVIDEISVVDKGANQLARQLIAKSATGQEEQMEIEIFDSEGQPLDPESLKDGDVVYGEDGQAYVFELEEDEAEQELEPEPEPELAAVGKSLAFQRKEVAKSGHSLVDSFREELSKALSDKDRDEVIAKALGAVETYAQQAQAAEEVAKAERDLRLEREYTEIAKSYNLPVEADQLGKVMKRMAETLSREECALVSKCFEAAGEAIFAEQGFRGGGDNSDVLAQAESIIDTEVRKGSAEVSKAQALSDFFTDHPEAYDDYLAER